MIEWGTICKNEKVASDIYQMVLSVQGIARSAKPGQFVNVRLDEKLDPLLRRPISLHEINPEDGTISMLYLVVGKGTKMLSKMEPGKKINVLGPLGNGFDTEFEGEYAVLAGGGIGIAPLYPLAQALCMQRKKVVLAAGAKNKAYLTDTAPYEELGIEVHIATDDGTGEDAIEYLLAGATGVAVGLANMLDPCATMNVIEGIEKYLEENGFSDIHEIIGLVWKE